MNFTLPTGKLRITIKEMRVTCTKYDTSRKEIITGTAKVKIKDGKNGKFPAVDYGTFKRPDKDMVKMKRKQVLIAALFGALLYRMVLLAKQSSPDNGLCNREQ